MQPSHSTIVVAGARGGGGSNGGEGGGGDGGGEGSGDGGGGEFVAGHESSNRAEVVPQCAVHMK